MTQSKKIILTGVASFVVILGTLYAGFPWLVTMIIRSQLTDLGMQDVEVQVEYPGMNQMMLRTLSFHGPLAENELKVKIPNISINYDLTGLLVGQLKNVRIPDVNIQMHIPDTPQSKATQQPPVALPLGFLSGRWLTDVPVEVLMLDRLKLDASTSSGTVYRLLLNAQLIDKHIQLVGEFSLPRLKAPLTFLAGAGESGQAHVHLVPNIEGESPLLTIEVRPPDNNQASVLNGRLHTRFNRLLPVMAPVLSSIYPSLRSAANLEGELSSQWQANWVNNRWQLKGKANINSLAGQWDDLKIPLSEWQGTYRLLDYQFESQSSLKSFDRKIQVDLSVQHNTKSGLGQARFDLNPVVFDNDTMQLSNVLKGWTLPVDLTTGRVSVSGTVTWKKQFDVHGQLQLQGLGGHYNETTFEGVNGKMDLAYANGIKTRQPVPLKVKHVNVGFPVRDFSMTFTLTPKPKLIIPVVNVKQFEAFLLGGRAYGGAFDYDYYREKNTFDVQLEGLAVHDLMELERQEGLSGEGLLDGSVPIEISNNEIIINNGKLTARKPGGAIKYKPTDKVAALAKTNTSLDLMVRALSNFKYDVLDVNTDYKAGGDLHLKVRLQGHNPEWQEGQPINLNLNVQENIPALLRSLQLSGEISEKVRKRVLEKSDQTR